MKSSLNSLCRFAGIPVTVEVYGIFAHLIPQEPLNRVEAGRARQSMVPDFRMDLPSPTGLTESHLAELKVVSCGDSRYRKCGWRESWAVDIRANQLPNEYRRKAEAADKLIGVQDGEVGPVQRRLSQFPPILGLVFGSFGEGSEGEHSLVNILAESRLRLQGLARGSEGSQQELALITGQIRRTISTAVVRANAACLLSRMSQVGEGASLASKRRDFVRLEEVKMRREREAQWLSRIRGRGLIRRGQFFSG